MENHSKLKKKFNTSFITLKSYKNWQTLDSYKKRAFLLFFFFFNVFACLLISDKEHRIWGQESPRMESAFHNICVT